MALNIERAAKVKAAEASRRGRSSKNKGSRFEREVGRDLSQWLTNGNRDDLFSRNVLSGGQFTISEGYRGQGGDLAGIHPIATTFLRHYIVECKHYANLGLEAFLFDRKGASFLSGVIGSLDDQARKRALGWIVLAKQDRRPPLIFADVGFVQHADAALKNAGLGVLLEWNVLSIHGLAHEGPPLKAFMTHWSSIEECVSGAHFMASHSKPKLRKKT